MYVVRLGLAPGTPLDEFRRWYDEVHLPRILRVPGFAWASRYETGGPDPHFITTYAIDGPDVLESAEYRSLPGFEHWRPAITDWFRAVYRLHEDLGDRDRKAS